MSPAIGVPYPMPDLPGPTLLDVALRLKHEAVQGVVRDSDEELGYMQRCTYDVLLSDKSGRGVRMIYTRSIERGFHFLDLSFSFRLARKNAALRFDHRFARGAAPVFFGPFLEQVLAYPPVSKGHRDWRIWRFRVFTTEAWTPDMSRAPLPGDDDPRLTWAEYSSATFP